jgi:hypothetical protein
MNEKEPAEVPVLLLFLNMVLLIKQKDASLMEVAGLNTKRQEAR